MIRIATCARTRSNVILWVVAKTPQRFSSILKSASEASRSIIRSPQIGLGAHALYKRNLLPSVISFIMMMTRSVLLLMLLADALEWIISKDDCLDGFADKGDRR